MAIFPTQFGTIEVKGISDERVDTRDPRGTRRRPIVRRTR